MTNQKTKKNKKKQPKSYLELLPHGFVFFVFFGSLFFFLVFVFFFAFCHAEDFCVLEQCLPEG